MSCVCVLPGRAGHEEEPHSPASAASRSTPETHDSVLQYHTLTTITQITYNHMTTLQQSGVWTPAHMSSIFHVRIIVKR